MDYTETYDLFEVLQKKQQRFEAALKYCTIECAESQTEPGRMDYPTYQEAIKLADGLLAVLEEPRT